MKTKERIERIKVWQKVMADMDKQQSVLMAITGGMDGPLFVAIGEIQARYTDAIAEIIGDDEKWLDWWWLECDYGKSAKEAALDSDMRPIRTPQDLAGLIE